MHLAQRKDIWNWKKNNVVIGHLWENIVRKKGDVRISTSIYSVVKWKVCHGYNSCILAIEIWDLMNSVHCAVKVVSCIFAVLYFASLRFVCVCVCKFGSRCVHVCRYAFIWPQSGYTNMHVDTHEKTVWCVPYTFMVTSIPHINNCFHCNCMLVPFSSIMLRARLFSCMCCQTSFYYNDTKWFWHSSCVPTSNNQQSKQANNQQ